MSRRVYLTDLDAFDAALAKNGGNLRATIEQIIEAAKQNRKMPFEAVDSLARPAQVARGSKKAGRGHGGND
jgi:hypothetical protein